VEAERRPSASHNPRRALGKTGADVFDLIRVLRADLPAKWAMSRLKAPLRDPQAALKVSATPLLQYRSPVGDGPSSNTWPWCPPQRAQ